MVISREREKKRVTSKVKSKLVILYRLDYRQPTIMVINREREERRVVSKSEKQAGDII